MASRDFHINIQEARHLDDRGDWSQLSLDLSGTNPQALYGFLSAVGAVSVTVQPKDFNVLIGNALFRDAIAANFDRFRPQLTDLPPDELFETLEQIAGVVLQHVPEQNIGRTQDPFYRETDEDRQHQQIENETQLQLIQEQAKADEEANRVARDGDGFWDV
jgi:hypothetical protein